MRSALGASRARLIRQALVESSVLGVLGVAAGIAVGWALVSLSRAFLPEAFLVPHAQPAEHRRARPGRRLGGRLSSPRSAAGLLPAWIGTRVDARRTSLRVVRARRHRNTRRPRAHPNGLLDWRDRARVHAARRRDAARPILRQPGQHRARPRSKAACMTATGCRCHVPRFRRTVRARTVMARALEQESASSRAFNKSPGPTAFRPRWRSSVRWATGRDQMCRAGQSSTWRCSRYQRRSGLLLALRYPPLSAAARSSHPDPQGQRHRR